MRSPSDELFVLMKFQHRNRCRRDHLVMIVWLISALINQVAGTCTEWTFAGSDEVNITESMKVGTEIYRLPKYVHHITNFEISETTNKDQRFGTVSNSSSGVVYLAGYLDFDIDSRYDLLLTWRNVTEPSSDECFRFALTVIVEEDTRWPQYFNETCCLCPHGKERLPNNPFPFQVYVGINDTPIQNAAFLYDEDDLYWDTYYTNECKMSLYLDTTDLVIVPLAGTITVKCLDNTTQNSYTMAQVYAYKTFEELPESSRLQHIAWFERKRPFENPILEIVMILEMHMLFNVHHRCTLIDSRGNVLLASNFKVEPTGCPDGKYGLFCNEDCICKNGATCHSVNGACICQAGWMGPACDIREKKVIMTPHYFAQMYGDYVNIRCTFYNFMAMNSTWLVNGSPASQYKDRNKLDFAWSANMTQMIVVSATDDLDGQIECLAVDIDGIVYTDSATFVIKGCQHNYYGDTCNYTCGCKNEASCDRYKGCVCTVPGWTGKHCDQECSADRYGPDCESECGCQNDAKCNRQDGTCECKSDKTCGDLCHVKCDCHHDQTYQCNATLDTCICTDDRSGSDSSRMYYLLSIIGAVALIIVLVGVVVFVYHRRNKYYRLYDREFEEMLKGLSPKIDSWIIKRSQIDVQGITLGMGEFGKVELADWMTGSQTTRVAVKTIISDVGSSLCYRNFCHEIDRLIDLQGHANIILLHGVITKGDPKYIVLEYASRGDLLSFVHEIRERPLQITDEYRLVNIARDVTCAMQYMESHKFVHRDLASRNILITEDFHGKIGDFGLSRDVYEDGRYCKVPWAEDQGPLPLKWMPPEFLNEGIFETKSDVWSFGVVLWEIVTLGEVPFMNISAMVFMKLLKDGVRLPKPANSTDAAFSLMVKCWHTDIESRPSPSVLKEELDTILQHDKKFFKTVNPDPLELTELSVVV
ncbi:uncharacterized protein LOC144433859 isoform X2 [Glandiceps talaboti]